MPEDDNKIKLEEVDEHFCEGCQHQFSWQEECKNCIYTVLYGEEDVDPEELEHLLKAMEKGCLTNCKECLFYILCYWEEWVEVQNHVKDAEKK